jgi:hypothetical protein
MIINTKKRKFMIAADQYNRCAKVTGYITVKSGRPHLNACFEILKNYVFIEINTIFVKVISHSSK